MNPKAFDQQVLNCMVSVSSARDECDAKGVAAQPSPAVVRSSRNPFRRAVADGNGGNGTSGSPSHTPPHSIPAVDFSPPAVGTHESTPWWEWETPPDAGGARVETPEVPSTWKRLVETTPGVDIGALRFA